MYVSKKIGNDETGNGTEYKPYASVKKAAREIESDGVIFVVEEDRQNISVDFYDNTDIKFQFWNPE